MPTLTWSDPRWRERTGADPVLLFTEALRRAVDIRDTDSAVRGRGVFLVDVLNELAAALHYEVDLWDGFDNYSE